MLLSNQARGKEPSQMSDTSTATEPEKATRNRFKGELSLGAIAEEAPPASTATDLTQFLSVVDRSWALRQANEDAKASGQDAPHAATAIGVTIPKDGKSLAETRFRQAATQRGIGVSVTVIEHDTERGKAYGLADSQVRMIVEARPKKKAPTKPAAAAGDPSDVAPPAPKAPANPAAAAAKGRK